MLRTLFCLLASFIVNVASEISNAEIDKCTTIIVGKTAGTEGPMTTHTADCSDCDFRLAKIPAMDWEEGTMRPLYLYKGNYPSTITSLRGVTWHPDNLEGTDEQIAAWGVESPTTGFIPQVAHTYALYEAGYGIMNEHQVAIGESTCASKFWAAPTTAGGKAQIEVREMSKIALERTKTARDAVILMGKLAVEYGFYAADWSGGDASKGEGGEALTVVDKNEAWVFHVLADDTGTSAVWAAQRVQDDHVAAVANQFIIRHIHPNHPDYLYSANIWDVAERNNLYDASHDGPLLDFLKTYAPMRAHSPYVTRRVWRVLTLVSPSYRTPLDVTSPDGSPGGLPLSPFTDTYASDYPFSVKADKALSPADLMHIQRDHYEGTQFDLTKGMQAGPYGDPNRFDSTPVDNLTRADIIQGSFERAISLFRTSYSIVAVARSSVPDSLALVWLCQYAPSSSSYAPFYVASAAVPLPYSRGSLFQYDPAVSFWNFLAAGNYAARFYRHTMVDVTALQLKLQEESFEACADVEGVAMSLLAQSNEEVSLVEMLTRATNDQALKIVGAWRDLLPKLITKYHDGYSAQGLTEKDIQMKRLFYPAWWLKATGYFDSHINTGPGVIMFAPSPYSTNAGWLFTLFLTAILSSALSLSIAYIFLNRNKQSWNGRTLDPDSFSPFSMYATQHKPLSTPMSVQHAQNSNIQMNQMNVHTNGQTVQPSRMYPITPAMARRKDYVVIDI